MQYNVPQIITIVPHRSVEQIFNRYMFKAIHKNTITVQNFNFNDFAGDLYQLKHTDVWEAIKINMANFIVFFFV